MEIATSAGGTGFAYVSNALSHVLLCFRSRFGFIRGLHKVLTAIGNFRKSALIGGGCVVHRPLVQLFAKASPVIVSRATAV